MSSQPGYLSCRCGGTRFDALNAEERRGVLGRVKTILSGYCSSCGKKAERTMAGPASQFRLI
ncbi:hypothetical protein ACFXD5_19685 [Streptomyces sp. NPDC059385]|uniref:hypothetical protein n=1 Tax=Streptomyces sp. NPDC059385 TaxID=3346817 RepID=UPI00368A500B